MMVDGELAEAGADVFARFGKVVKATLTQLLSKQEELLSSLLARREQLRARRVAESNAWTRLPPRCALC